MRNLIFLLCVLALCVVPACASAPPDVGFVGQVEAGSLQASRPEAFVAYDGDTLLAWAEVSASASLVSRATWAPVLPPAAVERGKVILQRRSTGLRWEGTLKDKLPLDAARVISPVQLAAWGIKLEGDVDAPAPPGGP